MYDVSSPYERLFGYLAAPVRFLMTGALFFFCCSGFPLRPLCRDFLFVRIILCRKQREYEMTTFTKAPDEYTRDLNFTENYIKDCALYLSRMRNIPLEEATEFIRIKLKSSDLKIKNPKVKYLQRDKKTGDRFLTEGTFLQYIADVAKFNLIMVPTMTVYLNPEQKKSYNAIWIDRNLKLRKQFKHEMFNAKMKGDKIKTSYYDILQNSCKIKNNSLSGAHSSPSTPLFNKSSHSTLTSTCRISTSYANASNEQLLRGNRHYWCPQVVLSHLITTARHSLLDDMKIVMAEERLHYPSVEDVMDCITYSTHLYWRDAHAMSYIRSFVEKITPIERAAFVYSADIYHLEKLNPDFVRTMFFTYAQKHRVPDYSDDAKLAMKDSDTSILALSICAKEADYRKLEEIRDEDPETYGIIAANAKSISETIARYSSFIKAFWRIELLSPSIAKLPSIVRRVVVTSDTDSSIFTTQYWTMKYSPNQLFAEMAYRIGYISTFFVSKVVKHRLAMMSKNIGAINTDIHKISMKNEYYFPVYLLTPSAKHYAAYRSAQEGNLLRELETEIKGVHLRNSSAPPHVTKQLKQYIQLILTTVMEQGQLSLNDIRNPIIALENDIINDINKSGYRYFNGMQIKDADSYTNGEEATNYKRYTLWQDTFAKVYSDAPNPPYQAIKIPLTTGTRKNFDAWLNSIESPILRDRLTRWSEVEGKREMKTIVIPESIILRYGIPKEIAAVIDIRKLVNTIASPFYLILESLGIYIQNNKISRLLSDDGE